MTIQQINHKVKRHTLRHLLRMLERLLVHVHLRLEARGITGDVLAAIDLAYGEVNAVRIGMDRAQEQSSTAA